MNGAAGDVEGPASGASMLIPAPPSRRLPECEEVVLFPGIVVVEKEDEDLIDLCIGRERRLQSAGVSLILQAYFILSAPPAPSTRSDRLEELNAFKLPSAERRGRLRDHGGSAFKPASLWSLAQLLSVCLY